MKLRKYIYLNLQEMKEIGQADHYVYFRNFVTAKEDIKSLYSNSGRFSVSN